MGLRAHTQSFPSFGGVLPKNEGGDSDPQDPQVPQPGSVLDSNTCPSSYKICLLDVFTHIKETVSMTNLSVSG